MRDAGPKPWAWLAPALWIGGLLPAVSLALRGAQGQLGANPIAEALNACGELAIKLLILCLACTPLRIVFGFRAQMRARKHLGLLAAAYASLHFGIYVGLDRLGDWSSLWGDLSERPFIIIGFVAFLLLIPLVVTSSARMVRRLGPRRWTMLHKTVYLVAILAVLHLVLRAKKDLTEAYAHGAVVMVLLLVRVVDKLRRWRRA